MSFVTVHIECDAEVAEILIAQLFEIGFDSFQELGNGLTGSIEESQFMEEATVGILKQFSTIKYSFEREEKVNWNKEWERNYDPILVEDRCLVRATFHPSQQLEYEIIVNPKMSFGTGHHATTYQMLAYQLDLDHTGKKVLDVGCGTGILAIMAKKRGAGAVFATDIDEWCIENSHENFELNEASDIQLYLTQIEGFEEDGFDLVIANINKNVLLDQLHYYEKKMNPGGKLLLSGFYEEDIEDLADLGKKLGLAKEFESVRDKWAMIALSKPFV